MQNNGFSNPFANQNPNPTNQSYGMSQGYTGLNSFVAKDPRQNQNTQNIINQQNTGNIRQSKIAASNDGNPQKRLFKGKYELNATIPVKYNTVDYFMLVENVRINNENALRELKRGKTKDILGKVLDSLEFLSYVHK